MKRRTIALVAIFLSSIMVLMLAVGPQMSDRSVLRSPLEGRAATPSDGEGKLSSTNIGINEVKYYTVDQVKQLLDYQTPLTIVNVDPLEHFEGGHIKGAISLPIDGLDESYKELDSTGLVILYCA